MYVKDKNNNFCNVNDSWTIVRNEIICTVSNFKYYMVLILAETEMSLIFWPTIYKLHDVLRQN